MWCSCATAPSSSPTAHAAARRCVTRGGRGGGGWVQGAGGYGGERRFAAAQRDLCAAKGWLEGDRASATVQRRSTTPTQACQTVSFHPLSCVHPPPTTRSRPPSMQGWCKGPFRYDFKVGVVLCCAVLCRAAPCRSSCCAALHRAVLRAVLHCAALCRASTRLLSAPCCAVPKLLCAVSLVLRRALSPLPLLVFLPFQDRPAYNCATFCTCALGWNYGEGVGR